MEEKEALKYVYFIYSLEKNKGREIISELKHFEPKIISSINKNDEKNINYDINLYLITVDKTKLKQNETRIKLKFLDKNNKNNYEYLIDITDKHQNIFLYDIEFESANNFIFYLKNSPPFPQYNLSMDEKYEIFKNKGKDNMEIDERNFEDLIYYTHKKLEKEKQYNFSFFVSILNDINIININDLDKHFELFNINKIIFDEKKIDLLFDVKKLLFLSQILINKNLDEDKLTHDCLCILIILYKYSHSSIEILFYSKDINIILYQILLEDKRKSNKKKLFPNLKLSNNILNDFIKTAQNYIDIVLIISFNDDFLESLELINKNINFIITEYKKERDKDKGKAESIKFDAFIKPKIKDDLTKIKNQIKILIEAENKYNINLVEYPSKFLEIYYNLHENNINELTYFFQIVKMVAIHKGVYKYGELATNVNEKLLKYALEGKLINMNLLLFMETTFLVNLDKKVLNNIDMDLINDKFIKKFKEIKWEGLLNIKKDSFINQVCLLTKNIKNFGKLFLLFDFNKDINKDQMNLIKEIFIDLLDTYNEKECNNIIEDCTKLIYFLNIKDCNLKSFFKDYFYNFFYNLAEKVFCNILSKYDYNSLNDELKNIIYDFYYDPKNKDLDKSIYLIYEIEKNENFNTNELVNYYINDEDFFDLKQNNKFSFLERIICKNLLNKKCLLEYGKNNKDQGKNIINKIRNGTVEYIKIKKFFSNDNVKVESKKE